MSQEPKPYSFYRDFSNHSLHPNNIFPDVGKYALEIGLYRSELARYLYLEENYRDELKHNLVRVQNERTRYYKKEHEEIFDKKDLPGVIASDPEVQSAETLLSTQENKIKFIENILKNLDNQSYLIGHYVKFKKWESGESD